MVLMGGTGQRGSIERAAQTHELFDGQGFAAAAWIDGLIFQKTGDLTFASMEPMA
jgi:hypothetical protein